MTGPDAAPAAVAPVTPKTPEGQKPGVSEAQVDVARATQPDPQEAVREAQQQALANHLAVQPPTEALQELASQSAVAPTTEQSVAPAEAPGNTSAAESTTSAQPSTAEVPTSTTQSSASTETSPSATAETASLPLRVTTSDAFQAIYSRLLTESGDPENAVNKQNAFKEAVNEYYKQKVLELFFVEGENGERQLTIPENVRKDPRFDIAIQKAFKGAYETGQMDNVVAIQLDALEDYVRAKDGEQLGEELAKKLPDLEKKRYREITKQVLQTYKDGRQASGNPLSDEAKAEIDHLLKLLADDKEKYFIWRILAAGMVILANEQLKAIGVDVAGGKLFQQQR